MVCVKNAWTSSPLSVLGTRRAVPPSSPDFSTKWTGKPWSASASATVMPGHAAADHQRAAADGRALVVQRHEARRTAAAIRTRSTAFSVARPGRPEWTQEHWSRMLAISNKYGFRPASRSVSRKIGLGCAAYTRPLPRDSTDARRSSP